MGAWDQHLGTQHRLSNKFGTIKSMSDNRQPI